MASTGMVVRDARIVVLDDNPTNVLLLEAMLEEDGFTQVTGYTNPVQALEEMLQSPPGSCPSGYPDAGFGRASGSGASDGEGQRLPAGYCADGTDRQ